MKARNIVAAIKHYERQATGLGELMEERSDALDRYLGRPYGDEVEGRSQVVMRDVADTIEWIKPSLLKVFAAGEEVCKFSPTGPEDEEAAEQETEYVNHILLNKNDGFLILHDWFHDALLQKTGYVLVTWEEESKVQIERFRGLTDDEFALLMQSPEIEVMEHSEMVEADQIRHDVAVRQVKTYGCPKVRNIPPERVFVATDYPGLNLQECPFAEVIEYPTISELREEGYEVPDDIQDTAATSDDEWETHRRDVNLDGEIDRDGIEATPEMRRVKIRRVWVRFDADGDGIAELRRVVLCGVTVLEDEEDDLVPIAAITPIRQPHEHYGLSVADIVMDLQRIRTVLVRGFLDSMYLANAGRNAVDVNRVNLDDLLTSRVGGVVRVNGDPNSAIVPLQHTHQGPAILQAVEYVDTIRENRTGVTAYNQGLDANSLNKTATGIQQIMQAATQRIDTIARVFAETGVKHLMLIIHAIAMKNSKQHEMLRMRGQWVPVDPRQWKSRRDLQVSVGLGTGNKDQMLAHLMMILQEQKQAMAVGLSNPQLMYNTLSKITQNAGFKMPEQFWADPAKFAPPPMPPSPEQIKAESEMQKAQFQAQQDAMKFQAESQLERERMAMQAELDRNRQEYEARQKQLELGQQAQFEQMRIDMQRQLDQERMAFERWKAELDANVKLATAQVGQPANEPDARIDQLMSVVSEIAEDIKSPAEIIRGPDGKAAGIRKGKRTMTIQRGPDGRPIGVQ